MVTNRRNILRGGLAGAIALAFRASATGLPASFLLTRQTHGADVSPKFTILAGSSGGESMNCSGFGSYSSNNNDLANLIDHPSSSEVPNTITQVVNGTELNVNDLANAANITLGSRTVRCARAYQALDQAFLDNLVGFWHQTGVNAHPEYGSVLQVNGALRSLAGNGSEQLPAAIAQETATVLGTSTNKPFVLNGGYTDQGLPLNTYRPTTVKDLLTGDARIPVSEDNFGQLYDQTIDTIHSALKSDGTPEQKRFLDAHASTRAQARQLGDELSSLLNEIDTNDQINELKTAMALIKVRLAPVIVVRHTYSGDNHADSTLENETLQTLQALEGLSEYWRLVNEYGLADQVVYATMNVFGRTPSRNSRGGRDHWGRLTQGFIHGANVQGGQIGDLDSFNNNRIQASGINSQTGTASQPDIAATDTLAAFSRTVMAAAGVAEDRLDARLPDAKTVNAAFRS